MYAVQKKRWIEPLKSIVLVVCGTLLLSFGAAVFVVPFDLVVGGVTGTAILLDKLLPAAWVTAPRLVTVLTWLLFFIGWAGLGRRFAVKTLISAIVYPPGLAFFSRLASPSVWNGFFCLSCTHYGDTAVLLAALFGGLCIGTGCAITFLGGGSTGGMDIPALLLCRRFPRLRSSAVIFALDAVVIVLGMWVLQDLAVSLLGILSAFISAWMVDRIFSGGEDALIAHIISHRCTEINQAIAVRLSRTTSSWTITGGYTGQPRQMLMVTFAVRQYRDLLQLLQQIDPAAFVTIHRAHQINGEGWTRPQMHRKS